MELIAKCKECGSTDVEIKGFVHQITEMVTYPDKIEVEDTWCIPCGEHTGVEFVPKE